ICRMPVETDFRVSINYKQILRIAMPIAFAIMVPQINFITNNIFLGRLSEKALAVAGITGDTMKYKSLIHKNFYAY
ncbi:hypothetical protein, partial [Klebsiella pneumoniae]|uniref:hypothetical protein n=1 Tax=Klebsiella pneumoniae TaxID=573 RepID=UPI003009E687